jgi:Uma2 family endonuclease
MTTTTRRFTLEDYLHYADGTDTRYELVAGELVVMPSESDLNNLIAIALIVAFGQLMPPRLLRRGTEIVISGVRTTTRIPDLMVLSEELALLLKGAARSIVLLDMPPPTLVVEIVSPGKDNEDRDYRYKRSEYAARGIPEYWIIDSLRQQVTVLTLVDGFYETVLFQSDERLRSTTFPSLTLTAEQILTVDET